jgi:hypothetical protein
MNMMSSPPDDVAYFRSENLDPDVRSMIGLSKDFDRIGPLPVAASITCTFRALIDWIGDEDPEQACPLQRSLLSPGMTAEVMSNMEVAFTRCDDPQPELRP